MTVAIYLGELIFAIALAIRLLAASTLEHSIAIFCYAAASRHGPGPNTLRIAFCSMPLPRYNTGVITLARKSRSTRPSGNMARLRCRLPDGGTTVLAGVLVVCARYLTFHYCAINPAIRPAPLLKHHRDHHEFANRNYGVTTKLWA